MQDRRHPLIGQVITLQAPALGDGPSVPEQFEVTELRGLTAVLSPVAGGNPPVLRPGIPVVVSFGADDDRKLEGIVLEGPWDGDVLLVRLPKLPERRAHPRFEEHFTIEVQVIEDTARPASVLPGKAIDVSAGGLRANLRKFLAAKQRAFISIELPDTMPVIGVAEVVADAVRAKEGGFEVRWKFTTLSDEERGRLLRYLQGGVTPERIPLPADNYHLEVFSGRE